MTKKKPIVAYFPDDLAQKIEKILAKCPQYRSRGHFIEVAVREFMKGVK